MNIVKLCFGFFLGGFVFGIFVVAVLGWINDAREDKELARLEKLKNDQGNKND